MDRSEESETAEPQKERRREVRCGQPRERTSVAVSERAQQNDRSNSLSPFAAFVRYTIALSVKYVQSAKINFSSLANL